MISHYGHVSAFTVQPIDPSQRPYDVFTHSIVIKNTGRKTATNVRLGHQTLPNVKVYPDIDYMINQLPGGGKEIIFPKIIPKKEVTVSYLYFPPLIYDQINTYVESDEGPAKIVNVLLQPQPPKWLVKVIWFFIISGIISVLYLVSSIIKKWLHS